MESILELEEATRDWPYIELPDKAIKAFLITEERIRHFVELITGKITTALDQYEISAQRKVALDTKIKAMWAGQQSILQEPEYQEWLQLKGELTRYSFTLERIARDLCYAPVDAVALVPPGVTTRLFVELVTHRKRSVSDFYKIFEKGLRGPRKLQSLYQAHCESIQMKIADMHARGIGAKKVERFSDGETVEISFAHSFADKIPHALAKLKTTTVAELLGEPRDALELGEKDDLSSEFRKILPTVQALAAQGGGI